MRSKFSTSLLNKVNASLIIVDLVFQILEGNLVFLIKRQFKVTAQSHAAEVVPENMSDLFGDDQFKAWTVKKYIPQYHFPGMH